MSDGTDDIDLVLSDSSEGEMVPASRGKVPGVRGRGIRKGKKGQKGVVSPDLSAIRQATGQIPTLNLKKTEAKSAAKSLIQVAAELAEKCQSLEGKAAEKLFRKMAVQLDEWADAEEQLKKVALKVKFSNTRVAGLTLRRQKKQAALVKVEIDAMEEAETGAFHL